MQQDHLVAAFRLVQVGGAEQHAHPLFPHQPLDDGPQLAPRHRIDADRGFVQQQQTGRPHQGAGQSEFLFHAAGQASRQPRGEAGQTHHVQQFGVASAPFGGQHPLQVGVQIQVLLDAQVLVQAEALRHVADRGLHRQRLAAHVQTQHPQFAGIGPQQAGGQPHQGGFAGAIRADQAGDPARRDRQADAVQGLDDPAAAGERLAESVANERGGPGDIGIGGHCVTPRSVGAVRNRGRANPGG